MSKQNLVVDTLQDQLAGLKPHEVRALRKLLDKRIPEFINETVNEAREVAKSKNKTEVDKLTETLVLEKLDYFEGERQALRRDPDLSEVGRDKRTKKLEADIKGYRPLAVQTLDRAWRSVRDQYQVIKTKQAEADRLEADRWNYNRLQYEGEVIKAKIRNIPDLVEAGRFIEDALNSGNIERARAAAEIGPGAIRSRFPGVDGERLAKNTERQLERLTTTPEQKAVNDQGHELVTRAVRLSEITQRTRDFYIPIGGQLWSNDEFVQMTKGITITPQFHPETLGTSYNLKIDEGEDGQGQAQAGSDAGAGGE